MHAYIGDVALEVNIWGRCVFLGTATENLVCDWYTGTGTVYEEQNKSFQSDVMVLFSCTEWTAKVIDNIMLTKLCLGNISAPTVIHYL
jgi:hypothetical protein